MGRNGMLCLCLVIASHLSWLGLVAAQTTVETYAETYAHMQGAQGRSRGGVGGGGFVTHYHPIVQEGPPLQRTHRWQ